MSGSRFRAPPADGLIVRTLDELTAIYHRASGATHVVTSPAPEILTALAGEWRSADELLEVLAHTYALADPDTGALRARVEELVQAGLVEVE